MTGYPSQRKRAFWKISAAISLAGVLLLPRAASAEEQTLSWARIDFLRNQVQLVPQNERARNARISDFLSIGDALRTARSARAELRFNDGSLARIGERATFRFTPNTRNFQLTNGTVLLLIPPERGRSTIQTPNAVTGIQGSALFVRYIPETDTTIVGALTDNPNGPMVLFNRDGSERQALQANQIGVIENDQIIQIFEFDSALFWQTSGLAQGFDYLQGASPTGSDALDAVRQEIRDAIAKQGEFLNDNRVIENPPAFARPAPSAAEDTPSSEEAEEVITNSPQEPNADGGSEVTDDLTAADSAAEEELEFEGSAAESYLHEPGADGANTEPTEDSTGETTSGNGTSLESDGGSEPNSEQSVSSDRPETVLDEIDGTDGTEPGEQSTEGLEDILPTDDSQNSESAIDDSTTPTQLPGRIRRNGDSNGTSAIAEPEPSTSSAEIVPASVAPMVDTSTSLESTAGGNRPSSLLLPQGNERVPSAAGAAAPSGGVPMNVPSAPEQPPVNVTIPDLNEQEIVPLSQGVPPHPELPMVNNLPHQGMNPVNDLPNGGETPVNDLPDGGENPPVDQPSNPTENFL